MQLNINVLKIILQDKKFKWLTIVAYGLKKIKICALKDSCTARTQCYSIR